MFFYEIFFKVFFGELMFIFILFKLINYGIKMTKYLFHFYKPIIFLLIIQTDYFEAEIYFINNF
jgi:hypothetical protein